MRRIKTYQLVLTLASLVLILGLVFRKRDLTIHLITESKFPKLDMQVKIDGEIVFKDSITSGAYFGEKIVIQNVGIGPHDLIITTELGSAFCQIKGFFLFNKSVIVNYFDESTSFDQGHFQSWRKFGEFTPD